MPLPGNREPLTAEKALRRLEMQCVKSEQCEREALDRMHRWGLSADVAVQVLGSLKARGFIDNARYAEAFVRDKYRFQRWGRRKLAYALSMKGISRSDADGAMERIDEGEYRRILGALLGARAKAMGGVARTYEGRTKLFRMAVSRGYEPELVADILRSMAAEEN